MDILGMIGEATGLMSTVLGATWWLSTRLERMSLKLEQHTVILREQISQIESQLDELKAAVASSRTELNELRERTVRLEACQEVRVGNRS